MAGSELEGMKMEQSRERFANEVDVALAQSARPFAIHNARKVDARGVAEHYWLVSDGSAIIAVGDRDADFAAACASVGLDADTDSVGSVGSDSSAAGSVTDAAGRMVAPGYVDIHAHGSWGSSFDDGVQGIRLARAGHMMHGTTRQVLSLITNPLDVMCANLETVHGMMSARPDILGAHLEGPFLALSRKGAHDPECLKDPVPEYVDRLLQAAGGCLRQITIAPELPHGIDAIRRFAAAGVVPAVGHCDADYATARKGFDAGAGIMTHMFNAMNGLHHREPGPIPAAVEDPRVTIELINDGFHVQNPMVRLGFGFAPHRTAFVTDAMAATDCPDGHYLLGALDVDGDRWSRSARVEWCDCRFHADVGKGCSACGARIGIHARRRGGGRHVDSGQSIRFRPREPGHQATSRSACSRLRCRRASARSRHLVRHPRLV